MAAKAAALLALVLLAGCVGTPFKVYHEEQTADTSGYPGLLVSGLVESDGGTLTLVVTAANQGREAFGIPDGCVRTWIESMWGPQGVVYPHGMQGSCHSLSMMRDFRPGESIAKTYTWNATLWDDAAQTDVPAPAGNYLWRIDFDIYPPHSENLLAPHRPVPLVFTIHVA